MKEVLSGFVDDNITVKENRNDGFGEREKEKPRESETSGRQG